MTRQWLWARAGIDAPHARVWIEFGINPSDAGRLVAEGATLAGTIRAWWDAGIPSAEVSRWIAAHISPQDAAIRQASGRLPESS
jgi:hypothetical protein